MDIRVLNEMHWMLCPNMSMHEKCVHHWIICCCVEKVVSIGREGYSSIVSDLSG